MKKRIFCQVFILFLVVFLSAGRATSQNSTDCCTIMHPDRETLRQWIEDFERAPRAPIDPEIKDMLERGDFAIGPKPILLDHITYTPAERNQGACGNCWVWGGTALMEIAQSAYYGVKDRLSVQFYNSQFEDGSNATGDYACCGGNLGRFANDYNNASRNLVPWSNVNAHFQDGGRNCASFRSNVPLGDIWTAPNHTYVSNISTQTITTHGVTQSTAINNIKNILHQNKGIYHSFCLADATDWGAFFNFWNNQNEATLWDPTPFFGHTWNPNPGQGGCHAVVVVGYNDDDANADNHYWIILNSWGSNNNRPNGLFRLRMNINYGGVILDPPNPNIGALWFETLGWVPWNSTNSLQMAIKGATNNNIYVRSKRMGFDWDPWYTIDGLTSHAPSVTTFNSRFFVAVKGATNNNIYIRPWYVFWWPWEVLSGGSTDVSPALVVYRNRLYVFVKGMDNLVYYKSMATGGVWSSSWSVIAGGYTTDTPAVVVYNDQLILFLRGTDNKIYLRRMGPDGTWGSWFHFPTGGTPSAPSATVYQNNIYLFVRGMNNNIYYAYTLNDSLYWNYWHQLPGQTTKSPYVTAGPGAYQLYVAVKGSTNNNIYFRFYDWIEQKWIPETYWDVAPGGTGDTPALGPYWW